jgi:hypothetical protein
MLGTTVVAGEHSELNYEDLEVAHGDIAQETFLELLDPATNGSTDQTYCRTARLFSARHLGHGPPPINSNTEFECPLTKLV